MMKKDKYIRDGRFDIEAALEDLNGLQAKYVSCDGNAGKKEIIADEFRCLHKTITQSGYAIFRHHKSIGGRRITTYTAKPNGNWVYYAPKESKRNDCTTRSIYFTLAETVPYDMIRQEQIKVARQFHWQHYAFRNARCAGWNSGSVWQQVLMNHGFLPMYLHRKVVRNDLAAMLVGCGRIATHSSAHCAGILDGTTYDGWDSTFKLCDYIFVKKSNWRKVRRALGELAGWAGMCRRSSSR